MKELLLLVVAISTIMMWMWLVQIHEDLGKIHSDICALASNDIARSQAIQKLLIQQKENLRK